LSSDLKWNPHIEYIVKKANKKLYPLRVLWRAGLDPRKCKEMLINFLHNPIFLLRPIQIGNNIIERVITYKSLGIILSSDLKWNPHIEYIVKKANKKLYPLRVLWRAGLDRNNLLKVYLCTYSKTGTWVRRSYLAKHSGLSIEGNWVGAKTSTKDNFLGVWIICRGPEFCTTTNFKHKKSPNMSEIHGQNEARKPSLIANPLSFLHDHDINLRQNTDRSYLFNVTDCRTFFFVQRHGWMMTHDYVTQKDQFLLTILPFNKRSFRSNHFELCNLIRMHVGRKQHILFTTLGRYR
jgi:hypothetical protein